MYNPMTELEVKPGYVYILKSTVLGGYKVGITTAPTSRFKALCVGTKAELIGYWKCEYYRELEKQLHKEYTEVRVPQSEWFDLDGLQLLDVIRKISSLGETEFLIPSIAQSLTHVMPHYKIVKTPPYKQGEYAGWNYFGITVLCTLVGILFAMN